MTDEQIKNSFIDSVKNWVCDSYSASIKFIAGVDNGEFSVWDSTITLSPLPPDVNNSFYIQGETIYVGQFDSISASQEELVQHIENALNGVVVTPNGVLKLPHTHDYRYYTEAAQRDLYVYQLHLGVVGGQNELATHNELLSIDNFLRQSTPPFDGLNDVAIWLRLKSSWNENRTTAINVSVHPPVDLSLDVSSLKNNIFVVVLKAHAQFDVELISLAITGFPGNNLDSRVQIAHTIVWQDIENGIRTGKAVATIDNCDHVLAMLLISNTVVRRHLFIDSSKARNNRLIAVQAFDKDLKMIKNSVLKNDNSHKFEGGVAALLFLLGFSPCVQLETDSPDIIVQTPRGRIVLIECTLKTSDFSSKLGKLVDRRGALKKELDKSGHPSQIAIALVCRLPRDQIAADDNELVNKEVLLLSCENLLSAFGQVRGHNDPDKILEDEEARLLAKTQMPFND